MTIIKGKVDYNKSISAWQAAQSSSIIKKFIEQSECQHNENIIEEIIVHPHNGNEHIVRQCCKCDKIL